MIGVPKMKDQLLKDSKVQLSFNLHYYNYNEKFRMVIDKMISCYINKKIDYFG